MYKTFQICLEFYKGYYLLFNLCFREEIKAKEKTYDFLDLSFLLLFPDSFQCHLFDDTQVSFYHTFL